jgi:hypothetical protein
VYLRPDPNRETQTMTVRAATWTVERLDANLNTINREPISRSLARALLAHRPRGFEAPVERERGYASYYIGSNEYESQWVVCSARW